MKLVTYAAAPPHDRPWPGVGPRTGALLADDVVLDLNAAFRARLADDGIEAAATIADAVVPTDMLALLRGGSYSMDAVRAAIEHVGGGRPDLCLPLDACRLLAPLPRPNTIRDFLAFESHLRNARKADPPDVWYEMPVHYKGNPDAVFGPDDVVPWPVYTDRLDYELEVAAVIGVPGRRVSADDAEAHIAGYMIFNDWSARDIQRREMSVGLGPALGKDFASSFGPYLVTPDEFDVGTATMRARVDGELWSGGRLRDMHYRFAEMIEWVSLEQELHAGDVLGSGTCGSGCGLELDRWIAPGSTVELEVDGLGVLRNTVGERPLGPVVTSTRAARS